MIERELIKSDESRKDFIKWAKRVQSDFDPDELTDLYPYIIFYMVYDSAKGLAIDVTLVYEDSLNFNGIDGENC